MIVTSGQMQKCEEAAFARGVSAAVLMEGAGKGIAQVVKQFFPKAGTLVLYLGKGNNAGDALVAARELRGGGWRVLARFAANPEEMKELPRSHLAEWVQPISDARHLTLPQRPLVLLDGLLGIGFSGTLRPEIAELVEEMNELRHHHGAKIIAMDLPSGLGGKIAVEAHVTTCVGQVKDVLVEDGADFYVGRIALVPLNELSEAEGDSGAVVMTPSLARHWMPQRPNDMHKGDAGRVLLLAGSRGFLGAAELACRGAIHAGAGLTTLLVKKEAYELLAARVPPEVMVRCVEDYTEALDMNADAIGIGPGLGFDHEREILQVLRACKAPCIIDADAITMLASRVDTLDAMRGLPRLLTPHPGEMQRLLAHYPGWHGMDRRTLAERFVKDTEGRTLLLKGARSVIATAAEPTVFNATGHAGMAAGGMGDVLSGVCAAFLARKVSPHRAAALGAWLCGRAAEMSGFRPVTASEVASRISSAMEE